MSQKIEYGYERIITEREKVHNQSLMFEVINEIATLSNDKGIEGFKIHNVIYDKNQPLGSSPVDIIRIIFKRT